MVIDDISSWILHKKNTGENSAFITFFTSKFGVVSALCRGCNSRNKQSILQQFTPLWVSFSEKSERFYVNKVEAQGSSLNFNMDSLFAGLYINELMYYLLQPLDEHQSLFFEYVNIINALQLSSDKLDIAVLLRNFELKLLSAIGYAINLTHDSQENLPVQENCYYHYYPDLGLIKNNQGIQGKYLLAIAENDFSEVETLKYAKLITRRSLDNCLAGKEIKSRRLYES